MGAVGARAGKGSPFAPPTWLLAAIGLLVLIFVACSDGEAHAWRFTRIRISAHAAGASPAAAHPQPPSPFRGPSREEYLRVQADPALLATAPDLLAAFEPAPWLLPPRTRALPYAGVHDFERLLELRSQSLGEQHSRSIAILLFSSGWAAMLQNSVYSMVKFGGVRNYIVATWSKPDLEACADLNLPCADVSGMLMKPLSFTAKYRQKTAKEGQQEFSLGLRYDFAVVTWLKVSLALRALQLNATVMVADSDIAYSPRPLWDSYLAFLNQSAADGAFMEEEPFNTGHFILRPTPAAIAFATSWNASGPAMLERKPPLAEQKGLDALAADGKFPLMPCSGLCSCVRARLKRKRQGQEESVAIVRSYPEPQRMYTDRRCTIASTDWMPRMDPCDWTVLYVHPICAAGASPKEQVLRWHGYWFVDSEEGCEPQAGAKSGVPACRPLQWRVPDAEAAFGNCPSYSLGLVHGGEPAALKELRRGASTKRIEKLLENC